MVGEQSLKNQQLQREVFFFSKYINLIKGFAAVIYLATGIEMATWHGQIKMH